MYTVIVSEIEILYVVDSMKYMRIVYLEDLIEPILRQVMHL